jgi:hypothetical protein
MTRPGEKPKAIGRRRPLVPANILRRHAGYHGPGSSSLVVPPAHESRVGHGLVEG